MSSDSESPSIHDEGKESDSDTYYTGEDSAGDQAEKEECSLKEEGDWQGSSDEGNWREGSEEDEVTDMSDLGENVTRIESFTSRAQTAQTVTTDHGRQKQYNEGCQSHPGTLVPSSELDIQKITDQFPEGSVTQCNVSQTYNVQQFGDVTVKGTRNLNIGGTQNISSKSGPSQEEEEEKPLTATQKIRKRTESKISAWTRGMVKTQGLVNVLDKIHKGATWVTIKGSPGEGKTTVAYMALEELYTEGKQVFQVISPEEFSEVIMTSSRPVIMLDDAFGDLEFDDTEWMRWKSALKQSLDITEHRSGEQDFLNRGPTIILTGRDYVLNSDSNHMGRLSEFITQEQYIVSMSHSVERTLQEKLDIWNAIVKAKGIELKESIISEILKIRSQHGFPHKCRLFAELYQSNNGICAQDFFKCPIIFLNKTLVTLMKNTDRLTFLRYMIKGDGKVSVRDLGRYTNGQELIQAANCLVGTYLKKVDGYFIFDHPSIYDCVSFNLCESHPQFAIENCNLTFIHQRLRFQDQISQSHHVAYIPRSYAEDLAKRFAAEIRNGNLLNVLSHDACTNTMFVEHLMLKVRLPFAELFKVCDKKTGDPFLCLIASNKSPKLLQYIHTTKGWLSRREMHMILFGICKFAATDALSYLLEVCGRLEVNIQIKPMMKSPLMIAAKSRDCEFVHQMLALNPDMNVRDTEHKTAFHYFCENGLESVVEKIILKGAVNINDVDKFHRSPLWFACVGNHIAVVKLLLKGGADTNKQTQDGFTPLHIAEKYGFTECVDILLNTGADVSTRPHDMCMSRTISEESESTECFGVLLKADYGVNEQDNDGNTPLHLAAWSPFTEELEKLLRTDTELNIQNKDGDTPLHRAIYSINCMDLLTKAGADVNVQNKNGDTPLHKAVKICSGECVNLLVNAGTGVNIQTMDGNTALHIAAEVTSDKCIDLLLKAGADVNAKNADGYTPLHSAAEVCSTECFDLLLKAGANVNAQSKDGNTPLHQSAAKGYERYADTLLKAGANVNIPNTSGQTPLHCVVKGRHNFDLWLAPDKAEIRICESLIRHGADVNKQNTDGNTPLHVLCRVDNDEVYRDKYFAVAPTQRKDFMAMVIQLVSNGADVNILNKKGKPALPQRDRSFLEK